MKRAWKAVLAGLFVAAIAMPAMAANPENFEGFQVQPQLTPGNATTNGWEFTENQGDPDIGIVASGSGIDGRSLRISNAYADGNFGNWLFSPRLPGGGVQEDGDGNKFIATYQIKSTSSSYQDSANPNFDPNDPNETDPPRVPLQVSVSPQSLDGARMSFLRFQDSPGGIDVYFADFQDDTGQDGGRTIQIANDLSRTQVHNVRMELDLYEGPHNDVAQVFIDGSDGLIPMLGDGFEGFFAPVDHPDTFNKLKAGQSIPMKWKFGGATPATTWEDYYRYNQESNPAGSNPDTWTTRKVDSLIFQARSGAGTAPATLGGGFLFDNVAITTGDTGTLPRGGAAGAFPGDASIYTEPIFSARQINCDTDADMDPLEEVATPGASHLTYDASTGVWHYNWQTRNTQKGTCVKITLNLTGDYALFKLVK